MQQARKKNEWYYEAGEWVTSSNKLLHEFTQFKSQNKGKKNKKNWLAVLSQLIGIQHSTSKKKRERKKLYRIKYSNCVNTDPQRWNTKMNENDQMLGLQ